MAEIRLNGVTKVWGAAPAVDHVSFAADAGTLLVLLGPSGCGKSTTLRLIAGLDLPDAGTIEIAGRDVTRAGRAGGRAVGALRMSTDHLHRALRWRSCHECAAG